MMRATAAASAARSPRRASTTRRTVRFAFVSCQSVNEGAQNAWRRMIWEDQRAPAGARLDFVLHLGDFIYEVVQYPDEVPRRYDRTIFDIGRIPDARKVSDLPRADDPRRLSRGLSRAHRRSRHPGCARLVPVRLHRRQPRVLVAGLAEHDQVQRQGRARAAVARGSQPGVVGIHPVARGQVVGPGLERFGPPKVVAAAIERVDADGFGDEPNNRAAVGRHDRRIGRFDSAGTWS
jgi:alkaline phosphatase D